MKFKGHFFQPLSSHSQPAVLVAENGKIRVDIKYGETAENLVVESIQDSRDIHFSCGSYFRSKDELPYEFLKQSQGAARLTISWLEKFTFPKAVLILLLVISTILVFRLIFFTVGANIALVFPVSWEKEIGENAYKSVRLLVFSESELIAPYQKRIRERTHRIIEAAQLDQRIELYFHKSSIIGPNALAFPGGPIVVTDELVRVLSNDEELLAIIAHEIAHVEGRHSLKQAVDIIGVSILFYLLFGADESIVEELSAVLVNSLALKNSRDFEKEADFSALQFLEASGIDPRHFVNAIRELTDYICRDNGNALDSDCGEGALHWISTHPSGKDRVNYLINEIAN